MPIRIVYAPAALRDLDSIERWIGGAADADTAIGYILRLRDKCRGLAVFPRRGSLRRSGLRSISFERRATIIYRVGRATVTILRVYHRGRDPGV